MAKAAAFCRLWNIENDIKEAEAKLAAHKNPAELTDEAFALVQTHQGQKIRKFASVDATTTVEAAIAFHEHRHQYPYAWRKEAAERLLKAASAHQACLPEYVAIYLTKAAGHASPTTDSIDDVMVSRSSRTPQSMRDLSDAFIGAMDKVATDEAAHQDPEIVDLTLRAIDSYDREVKLAGYYGHGLELPEEMLVIPHAKLAKIAEEAGRTIRLVNGHEIKVSSLTPEILEAVMDGAGSMGNAKLAEVLPTLPKPDADLLVELLPKTAFVKSAAHLMGGAPTTPLKAAVPPAAGQGAPGLSDTLNDSNFDQQGALAASMPAAPAAPAVPATGALQPGSFQAPANSLADKTIATQRASGVAPANQTYGIAANIRK